MSRPEIYALREVRRCSWVVSPFELEASGRRGPVAEHEHG